VSLVGVLRGISAERAVGGTLLGASALLAVATFGPLAVFSSDSGRDWVTPLDHIHVGPWWHAAAIAITLGAGFWTIRRGRLWPTVTTLPVSVFLLIVALDVTGDINHFNDATRDQVVNGTIIVEGGIPGITPLTESRSAPGPYRGITIGWVTWACLAAATLTGSSLLGAGYVHTRRRQRTGDDAESLRSAD
jgi:hypothetical protein